MRFEKNLKDQCLSKVVDALRNKDCWTWVSQIYVQQGSYCV